MRYSAATARGSRCRPAAGAASRACSALGALIANAGHRVLLHDRRNCGASDVAIEGDESEYEIWADDLHALLRELDAVPAYVGGASSGCRLAILFALRHPAAVRGLLLWRITGSGVAARRLAQKYYGDFIAIAQQGGMAAVCASEHFSERIAERPENRARLMAMDPAHFIAVMSNWSRHFMEGADLPIIGATAAQLKSIKAPACIVPGNDNSHPRAVGENLGTLLPDAEAHRLLMTDYDLDLSPREEWDAKNGALASLFVNFMQRTAAALTAIMLVSFAPDGWSQTASYPAKLIRIVNPVAPGGNQETVARIYADQLSRAFGQPVVVETPRRARAATIGTRYVKGSPPDGYTLLAMSNTFTRVPALTADAGYDPLRDFAAISQTSDVPLVLVVNPALPVKSVRELIALAKQRPGELTHASSGIGSTGHVAAAMFSRQAGIRLLDIPYKGAAPAVIDLVGGHVMLRFDQTITSIPFIRSGKLRALGVTTRKRSPALPEVPTIDEAGLPGFQDSTFNGLLAPAGTPREVIERLHAEIAKAAAVTELHNRFIEQGIELTSSTSPEEFTAFLRRQVEEFAILARQMGMKAD